MALWSTVGEGGEKKKMLGNLSKGLSPERGKKRKRGGGHHCLLHHQRGKSTSFPLLFMGGVGKKEGKSSFANRKGGTLRYPPMICAPGKKKEGKGL